MVQYTFRRSTLTKPETWTLFKEGIRYAETGAPPADYAFSQLQSVRLSYFPTRMKPNNYVCTLTFVPQFASGNYKNTFEIKLMSVSYKGFADFEDKANDYRAFIEAMVAAAIQENPAVQLISGKKTGNYILENLAVLAILAILFYFFSLLGSAGFKTFIVIKLGLVLYALFYIWKSFKANKPGIFTAETIPQNILPTPLVQ